MKRKFLILTLCFIILFTNVNKSYAESRFAPAVPLVAPQVISSLGALMVMCGVKYVDYKELNGSIRDIWETKDFQTEILPSIENSISNSVNGIVTFGENVVNWFKDIYFPTVQPGKNVIISDLPCYFPSVEESKYFQSGSLPSSSSLNVDVSPSWDITYGVSVPDIDLGNGFKLVYNGQSFVYLYYNGSPIVGCNIKNTSNYSGSVSFVYVKERLYFMAKTSRGWAVGIDNILKLLSSVYNGDVVTSWDNVGTFPNINTNDKEISIPIPGDINDLIGVDSWNPSVDKVWTGTDSISVPSLDKPLIGVGDDILVDVPDVDVPDVDVPGANDPDVIFPPFPSFGNSLDFSPMYLTNINEKFPFSLPWDIGRLIDKFVVEPKAPIFKVPIVTSEIELDLTIFDEWANIGRFFVLIGFALSLILISTKLLG